MQTKKSEDANKKITKLQTIEGLEPISQRINFLIQRLENGVQRRFAMRVGVPPGRISELLGGRQTRPSAELLQKIADAYPEVRTEWLLKEQGEMLKSADSDKDQNILPYPAPGTREVVAIGPLTDQPYVDLPAPDFKTLAHFGQQPGLSLKSFANSPTLRLYLGPDELPSHYVGAIVVTIFGDSMEPDLHDGERMVVWHIPDGKWEQLHNTVCVVSYDDTVTIKGIAENDLFVHDRLTLRAANPPSSYFVVGRNSISSIWEVREYYDRPKYRPSFIRR